MIPVYIPCRFIITMLYFLSTSFAEQEPKECRELTLPSGIPLYCPTADDAEKTDCCYGKGLPYCCKIDDYEQQLVMVVALSVITICFLLTVLIVICCFCPRCLLYDTCRSNYTRGEVIAYTKEEEMALHSSMPPEDQDEKSSYCTKPITIKPIADV